MLRVFVTFSHLQSVKSHRTRYNLAQGSMRVRVLVIAILLLALWVVELPSQGASANASTQASEELPARARFSHLTTKQGLSESTVLAIAQDDRGFLWFGTQNGLDRYDGYTIEEFNGPAPLPSKNIHALLSEGSQLWVGTRGGGLLLLDLSTGNLTVFSSTSEQEELRPGSNFIYALFRDTQGRIWVGSDNGLDRLNEEHTAFTHYNIPGAKSQVVYALAEGTEGTLWLGTDAGVFQLKVDAPKIETQPAIQIDSPPITALWTDTKRNQLWAATRGGLYRLDIASGQTSHFIHDPTDPNSLSSDVTGALFSNQPDRLWVATENGLDLLDLNSNKVNMHLKHDDSDPTSLPDGLVLCVFQDNTGGIWFGTWTSGVAHYHPARFKFPGAISIPSFPVSFAQGQNDTLWVGTFEQGLLHLGQDGQILSTYQHQDDDPNSLPNNAVMALLKDRQGRLWIGTLAGLCQLTEENTLQIYPALQARVRSLFEDRQGFIWIGTMEGLFRFDPSSEEIIHYQYRESPGSLSNNAVLSIFQDHTGKLWFGTSNGLNRLEADQTFSQPVNVENSGITVIHEDDQNNLWLGTWGSGLAQIDPARQNIHYYNKADGLADNIVLGILQDASRHLWISTSQGLSRFNLNDPSIRTFGVGDGLTGVDFAQGAFLKLADGQLLFGGTGLTAFDPEHLPVNATPPRVVLTRFQIFNQDVTPGADSPLSRNIEYTDHVTLRHDQSIFSLEFVALNFVNTENNEYNYRLDGVDPNWNRTRDRRFATYTNLDPGTYTFYVHAANSDGVWNNEGASLRITILPPWWRTWWAYLSYVLLAVGFVAGYANLRNRQYREKLSTQQKLLAQEHHLRSLLEQLDMIQEEDRRRIAHEMHDGLAQTLASLRLRSRVWHTFLEKSPEKLHAEFENLEHILGESIQEVRRSIFALRPIALDELGLFPALRTLARETGERYDIDIQVEIPCPEQIIHHSLEHTLFRVAQELLRNVGKHSQAAHARLELSCAEQVVRLTISDDGRGLDPDHLQAEPSIPSEKDRLGLRQMRERVEILGGSLHIDSQPSGGTCVKVEIPLVK